MYQSILTKKIIIELFFKLANYRLILSAQTNVQIHMQLNI